MSALEPRPDAERLRHLNALLEVALALPQCELEPWLSALPQEQQSYIPLLNAMLERAAVETDTFMRRPLGVTLDDIDELEVIADRPGDRVGPYRLVRELGAGGMATVWLAERADGSLQRQVALKLPRSGWALGLSQRMARERDILAALEHPRIARLYDAGVTESGRPYMAMEYVDGVAIDVYWRRHALGAEQGLRLILQVAEAVAYAHYRLVVHRDLKPSNILVTADGEVRLLDFGVAKLLADDRDTPLTQLIGRAFTPDYASPEQIRGKPMSMASDVYSLAVVLYELLTGQRPYRLKRETAAALEEAIAHADVPLASSRVASDRKLARALRGDIDIVLAKALKKNARDRYASVEAFGADIARHLAGEPVQARPDTFTYRFAKFARRQRGVLVTGALVFAAITTGLVGTLTQARRAGRLAVQAQAERDTAVKDLAFAEASESFMRFILSEGSDEPFTTADLLARADRAVDARYADDAPLRARMQLMVSDLKGDQRDFKGALAVIERAQASALATGDASLLARLECRSAIYQSATGRVDVAELLFAKAMRRLSAQAHPDNDARIDCYMEHARFLSRAARPQESIDDAQEALRLLGTPRPTQAEAVIGLQMTIADGYDALGQTARAVEIYEQQFDAAERIGAGKASLATTMANNLGVLLGRVGQLQRAASAYERGIAVASAAGEPRDHALMISYARLLIELGRTSEALPLLERATAASERAGDPLFSALGAFGLAAAQCQLHHWTPCDRRLDDARAKLRPIVPPGRALWGTVEVVAARSSIARGDLRRADQQLRDALALYDAAEDRNVGRVRAIALLARVEAQLGDHAAAQAHAAQALELAQAETAGFPRSEWVGSALLAQGIVHKLSGDVDAARTDLRDAVDHLHASAGDRAPATQEAVTLLAALK